MGEIRYEKLYGPWAGLMEHPGEATPNHLEGAWNLEPPWGNVLTQRKGRVTFTQTAIVRPTQVLDVFPGDPAAASFIDATPIVTDGDTGTFVSGILSAANHHLYIGAPLRFSQLLWTLGAAGANANAATLTFEYWDGFFWRTLTVTDGTKPGSAPFAQSGAQTWTLPNDWRTGNADLYLDTRADLNLFWLRISTSALLSGSWKAAELRINLNPGGGSDLRTAINGLREHVLRSGQRRFLIGMDDPGSGGIGILRRPETARLFWWDPAGDELVGVPLPESALATSPVAFWNFVSVNGYLLATNGETPIVRYDDAACVLLEAVYGNDYQGGRGRAYLGAVPRGRFMAFFKGQLYVCGHRSAPNLIYFSEYDNAINNIPSNGSAPVGGANVWPAENTLDVSTSDGDELTGVEVFGETIVFFKRNSIFVWDGNVLRQVERGVGCVAPWTIKNIGHVIIFLGDGAFYAFDGIRATPISYAVQPTLEKYLARGSCERAVAVHFKRRKQYRVYLPMTHSTENRLCLVYDYQRKGWVPWGGAPPWFGDTVRSVATREMRVASVATAEIGTGIETVITGDYLGNMWVEDRGNLDHTSKIFWYAAFKRLAFGESLSQFRWRDVRVEAACTGTIIKAALLVEGEQFRSIEGQEATIWSFYDAFAYAMLDGQAMFVNNNFGGSSVFPVVVNGHVPALQFSQLRLSMGKTARHVQLVLFGESNDVASANNYNGQAIIRGVEFEFRLRKGRR